MKPKAYEGNKPYIFISYAHKDKELVFRVMNSLQEEGYRIWYDDGIMPGSEWPENIAQHLDAAAMVIAMVTPDSMDSHNCRREINFALSRRKPFLAIMLEPTKMSLGMEMQLSAQRNVYLHNYAKWDDFIDKILICEDLQPCKEEVIAPVTEAPAVETVEEKPVVAEVPAVVTDEPAEVVHKKPAKLRKPKKEKVPKVKKERPAKPKKPIGKTLLAAVACIALVAVVVFGIKKANAVEVSWGQSFDKSATSISVHGRVLQQSDLRAIAGMPKLKTVYFTDCDFSACDFKGLQFASDQLSSLYIENSESNPGINDYGFLENLPLTGLSLKGGTSFTDLSVLNQSKLGSLDISGTGVSDLSLLTARLTDLRFANTAVNDVSCLSYLTEACRIDGCNTDVTNIDVLAELENLQMLYFSGCALEPIGVPFRALRLNALHFADCGLSDFSAFSNATRLQELDVSGNPELQDMGWLNAQNQETLKYLYLNDTGLAADDIGFLAKSSKLQRLNISGISVENLAMCKLMSELKILYAVNCGLKDISGLKDCAKMETLGLGFNNIEDVAVLKGLENLREADLSFNKVKTLSSLSGKKIRTFLVHGNDPALAATFPEGLTGYNLSVDWHVGIYDSGLMERGAYTAVYLMNCPADQVLNTQDVMGKGYCNFTDTAAFMELAGNGELSYQYELDYSYASDLYRSGT